MPDEDPMQPDPPMQGSQRLSPISGKPCGKRGCTKLKHGGVLCDGPAITGTDRCRMHGGRKSSDLIAQGEVRKLVTAWGLGDATVDPGETLLRLVSQSAVRAERYAAEIAQLVDEAPSLEKALIGEAWGEGGKQCEYVRGLARLEAEERDRCAMFATKAIAAGLAERQVRLAEQHGALLAGAIQQILGALDLTVDQQARVQVVVPRVLRGLAA